MPQLSDEARNLNWLVGNFTRTTPGVAHASVITADGLPIAVSDRLDRPRADQLATIASGLASLTRGAATSFQAGAIKQTIVQMEQGFLFIVSIGDGSCLAVLAAPTCQVDVVAYEMALLVARVGGALTPTIRAELHAALPT
jgi:uncharacterized protein